MRFPHLKKGDDGGGGYEEMLLDDHEFEEATDDREQEKGVGMRKSRVKSWLWMGLSVVATLRGRRLLRGDFGYPFYLTFLIQIAAYLLVIVTVLLRTLINFRRAKRKEEEKYKWRELLLVVLRILVSSAFAGSAMLCGVKALMLFENLPVLAMLPILTYAFDSILFRLAYLCRLLPRGQDISYWRLPKVLLVILGSAVLVSQDSRLDIEALTFASAHSGFLSLSKVFIKIGPKVGPKEGNLWEDPMQVYLLSSIIPLVMSGFATENLENLVMAGHIAQSWSITYYLINIGPAVVLLALFSSSMNSTYPFISEMHVGGALEEPSQPAREAFTTTLHSGFWILVIGVLSQEYNFVDWSQVLAFVLTYVVCIGPKHIGYYPPRLLNIMARLFRQRPLPIRPEPWQYIFFLTTTTIIFSGLISTNVVHWVDTIAYKRSLNTFHVPATPSLDQGYRPPKVRSFDIVIVHSAGDPLSTLANLMSTIQTHALLNYALQPQVILYSKDSLFNSSATSPDQENLKGAFSGDLTIHPLPNIGGPTASILQHILNSWSTLPVQTLFLSTSTFVSSSNAFSLLTTHLYRYFTPAAFPLPDAMPKTGFLSLGPIEVCSCHHCTDTHGWVDSFGLLPSLYPAANPKSSACENVLLTYGNNFIASAARLRGLDKQVYQLLYDALTKEDWKNSWAHEKQKLPTILDGEGNWGRWADGGVYSEADSKENPWLGYTVERLWGVLLQCSEGRIAWGCAGYGKERFGGGREDCGCSE